MIIERNIDHNYILILIVFISSIVFFYFQIVKHDVLFELYKYNNIVNNKNKFTIIVNQQQNIEINKGQSIAKRLKPEAFNFSCIDFGNFIIPVRMGPKYLMQAIRRGKGDAWAVTKSTPVDVASEQFCDYIILQYSDNMIECGIDMFEKLGYSGFRENHWCFSSKSKILQKYNL